MTTQAPATFGLDIGCSALAEDADELFSAAIGLPVVLQDMRHRLLTDTVLGPGGDAWGFDLRKLLGATAGTLASYQPRIRKVVLQDPRVKSASVNILENGTGPLRSLSVTVAGMSAFGPFRLIFTLDPTTDPADLAAIIVSQ